MNIKRTLIALAVEILADRTTIVRKSDPMDNFIHAMFGVETDEQRMTRSIEETVDQVTETVKRAKTKREFKKIVQNVDVYERES